MQGANSDMSRSGGDVTETSACYLLVITRWTTPRPPGHVTYVLRKGIQWSVHNCCTKYPIFGGECFFA